MSAIGDDLEYLRYSTFDTFNPNTLFVTVWSHHDTSYPTGEHPIIATSLHLSPTQRHEFKQELYATYEKKYGKRAPPSYYAIDKRFEVIASPELHDFTTEMTHLDKQGIVVLISNIKYLPRLALINPSPDMDALIQEYGDQFIEQLMTTNRVLAEIKADTLSWYTDLRNPAHDTGWITLK